MLKFAFYLIGNYFSNLFTEIQIWLGRFFREIKEIPAKIFLTSKDVNKDIKRKINFAIMFII